MHYWYGLAAKLLLLIPSLAGFAVAEAQDVLPPEEAFPYTIEASSDQLLLKFDVQDGYYLYRERFDFASQTAAVTLGAAVLPNGEIHEDEFFGVVETYRGQFEVRIPYWRSTETDELADLVADRALRSSEFQRGAGKAEMPGSRFKGPERRRRRQYARSVRH